MSGLIPKHTLTLFANYILAQCCHITTTSCGNQVIPLYGQTAEGLNINLLLEKLETREVFYEYGTDRITTASSFRSRFFFLTLYVTSYYSTTLLKIHYNFFHETCVENDITSYSHVQYGLFYVSYKSFHWTSKKGKLITAFLTDKGVCSPF